MSTGLNSVVFIGYPSPGDLIAASVVLPVVGLVAISLRYFVRHSRRVSLGTDDWLMIPALLAVIGMGACIITGVRKKAIGYPSPPPPASMEEYLNDLDPVTALSEKLDFSITILMILAYCFIKLSIVFLYRRIFVVPGYWLVFNIATWVLIGIIIAWTITFVFVFIFDCGSHVSAEWGSREALSLYCSAGLKHEEALYISEFITNVLLLLAPIPAILRLHLKTSVKFQVFGILLLAFAAFAASIVRFIIIIEIVNTVTFGSDFDIDQTNSTIFYWSMIEAGLALIACCLPVLKPLVYDRDLGSVFASVRSRITLRSDRSNASQNSKAWSRGTETSRTYTKTDREGSLAAPLKEDHVEMNTYGSREPSGEHAV